MCRRARARARRAPVCPYWRAGVALARRPHLGCRPGAARARRCAPRQGLVVHVRRVQRAHGRSRPPACLLLPAACAPQGRRAGGYRRSVGCTRSAPTSSMVGFVWRVHDAACTTDRDLAAALLSACIAPLLAAAHGSSWGRWPRHCLFAARAAGYLRHCCAPYDLRQTLPNWVCVRCASALLCGSVLCRRGGSVGPRGAPAAPYAGATR